MAAVEDYNFEGTEAGAAQEIPMEAGQIKKGGYMNIKGRPCKVSEVSVSKTGKHGHAKCNFITYDIFTNKKIEDMVPSTHGTTVPTITRTEYSLNSIDDEGFLSLMSEDGEIREDLKLSDIEHWAEVNQQVTQGFEEDKALILTVLKAMGEECVIACKEDTSI